MKVELIKKEIADFAKAILLWPREEWDLWQGLGRFQAHWDIDADDFSAMLQAAIPVDIHELDRVQYRPLSCLHLFASQQDDLLRAALQDLFNEDKDLDGRVGRFLFHADQLLVHCQENNAQITSHDMSDKTLIFTLLSYRYPQIYAPYQYPYVGYFLQQVESRQAYPFDDFERFVKLTKAVLVFMKKDNVLRENLAIIEKKYNITTDGDMPMLMVYYLLKHVALKG